MGRFYTAVLTSGKKKEKERNDNDFGGVVVFSREFSWSFVSVMNIAEVPPVIIRDARRSDY